MCRKIVQVTKDNINRIRKSLDCDFVSLTLTLDMKTAKNMLQNQQHDISPCLYRGQ